MCSNWGYSTVHGALHGENRAMAHVVQSATLHAPADTGVYATHNKLGLIIVNIQYVWQNGLQLYFV